jgi:hypothetical protein
MLLSVREAKPPVAERCRPGITTPRWHGACGALVGAMMVYAVTMSAVSVESSTVTFARLSFRTTTPLPETVSVDSSLITPAEICAR